MGRVGLAGQTRGNKGPVRVSLCSRRNSVVLSSSLQTRQEPCGGRWMPRATTRCQDATLVQLCGDCADAGDALCAQVVHDGPGVLRTMLGVSPHGTHTGLSGHIVHCATVRVLFPTGPEDLSGRRVDQVRPSAGCASHRHISLATARCWIVSNPALDVQARVGAAVDKRSHVRLGCSEIESGQDRSRDTRGESSAKAASLFGSRLRAT